ncbi:MAG: hypothetical protein H6704_15955 [Myxococcales bacterium]|nr:hypothetical protein [Myxococcales bacterium]
MTATTARTLRILTLAAAVVAAAGCADEAEDSGPSSGVAALSASDVVVGETLEVYGNALVPEDATDVRVVFEGVYVDDTGREEPVNRAFPGVADGEIELDGDVLQAVRVARLGPFSNPFSSADRPGAFTGTVHVEATGADGMVTKSRGKEARLAVGPSLIIEGFAPIDAECGAPALRALSGLPYKLTVRAVGIKATRFIYELSNVNGIQGAAQFEHDFGAGNPVERDGLGLDELVVFNPVPDVEQFYVAGIRVLAFDDEGNQVETALPMSVHRPLEVVYQGKRELAERYEPKPVSGCIPGSVRSRVSYTETRTETRQLSVGVTVSNNFLRSVGETVNQSWREGITEGESRSRTLGSAEREEEAIRESYGVTYGQSEANDVRFESTDGESWNWNLSQGMSNTEYEERLNTLYGDVSGSVTVGAEASGSVPGFAKVTGKASTTVGVRAGGSTAGTTGGSRTNTRNEGFSMAGDRSETRAFGSTLTERSSQSLTGSYALTRARQRSQSDTEARSQSRTWDFNQGFSESDIVSEGISESEQRTWVESASDQTVQAFSGSIPRSKVGIFYRQTTRWVRRAEVRAYNLCGLGRHVGELQFNEWTWAPDLAIGDDCDALPPPSQLPSAACFVEPCGG